MSNLQNIQTIGSGAGFPVELTTIAGTDGVETVTYQISEGDIRLIKQNLTSLLLFQVGQYIRNELFGTRVYEVLEEPNTLASAHLVKKYIGDAISAWEPRIRNLRIESSRGPDTIYLKIQFQVNQSQSVEELNFEYNPTKNTIDAY